MGRKNTAEKYVPDTRELDLLDKMQILKRADPALLSAISRDPRGPDLISPVRHTAGREA